VGAAKEPGDAAHEGRIASVGRVPITAAWKAPPPGRGRRSVPDRGGRPLAFFPLSSAPFADTKLVLLTLGTLLLWVWGVPVDRRLAPPAGVWIAVVVAAALTGVDPRMSIIGAANHGTGLIMLAACGSLVVLGPNIPPDAASRMRGWLVGAGLVVAAVAVGFRLAPDAFDRVVSDLSFLGSTAGNPVFAAAFLTARASRPPSDRRARRDAGWYRSSRSWPWGSPRTASARSCCRSWPSPRACGPYGRIGRGSGRASAFGRAGVGAALAAMLLVSCLALGASGLEQWGRTH